MKFLIHNSKLLIHNVNPQKGFTLIETFVAITVLIFSIAGPLSLVSQGLFASLRAKDQLIATYLAESVLEEIRNMRDTNMINDQDFDTGFSSCYSPNVCTVDISSDTVEVCSGGECPALEFNTVTGEYGYDDENDTWEVSKFTRYFTVETIENDTTPGDDEIRVIATTEFEAGFLTKTVELSDRFLTWQEGI